MRRLISIRAGFWPLLLAILLAGTVSISGCSDDVASGPPKISYGRDTCDFCHMIISEARYAAAYRDGNGKPYVFDDIEDLVLHAEEHGHSSEMTAWVHDYNTEEWLEVDDAWFVFSPEIPTPMAGGMVAFETEQAANDFAETVEGEVLRWDGILAHVAEGGDAGSMQEHGGH